MRLRLRDIRIILTPAAEVVYAAGAKGYIYSVVLSSQSSRDPTVIDDVGWVVKM